MTKLLLPLALILVGCGEAPPDISAEKSPSATGAPPPSSGGTRRASVDLPVVPAGQGDALK